jgi:hypothetical protein
MLGLHQFFWAGFLVCTLVLTVLLDGFHAWLYTESQPAYSPRSTTIRRFWYRGARGSHGWALAGPVYVTVFYLVFSQVWHLFMSFLSSSDFWEYTLPVGIRFKTLDHLVNGTFILYLVIALFGSVSPQCRSRHTEAIAIIVTLLAACGTHVMISYASHF